MFIGNCLVLYGFGNRNEWEITSIKIKRLFTFRLIPSEFSFLASYLLSRQQFLFTYPVSLLPFINGELVKRNI